MTKLLKIAVFSVPACAMLALTQPASAADRATAAAAGAASAASVQAKASETKKVCINVIPDTGSRMARRMCKTKAEWADEGLDLDAKK
jgi:hypothetical protein